MMAFFRNIFLFSLVLVACSPNQKVSEPRPSKESIQQWWKAETHFDVLSFFDVTTHKKNKVLVANIEMVVADDQKELAVLYIDPQTKSVGQIAGLGKVLQILDLNNDGISEIYGAQFVDIKNDTRGSLFFGVITEDRFEILREASFNEMNADCGFSDDETKELNVSILKCQENKVSWEFVDVNKDGQKELVEKKQIKEWENKKLLSEKEVVEKFQLLTNELKKID